MGTAWQNVAEVGDKGIKVELAPAEPTLSEALSLLLSAG